MKVTWKPPQVLCGPALGLATGHAVSVALGFIYDDPMTEITLSICSAYGVFVLAEMVTIDGASFTRARGAAGSDARGEDSRSPLSRRVRSSLARTTALGRLVPLRGSLRSWEGKG